MGTYHLPVAQTIDSLTLDSYKTFEKISTPSEWERFEPGIIARLESAWRQEKLKILMYRREHEQALAVLTKERRPLHDWDGSGELKVAEHLGKLFPEKILPYYTSF